MPPPLTVAPDVTARDAALGISPPTAKILLDTGPSKAGAHRLQKALLCPALYALTTPRRSAPSGPRLVLAAGDGAPDPVTTTHRVVVEEDCGPLVRGSIGHAALAHHYAALGSTQVGRPNVYYSPHEAIDLVADKFGAMGEKYRDLIHRVYDSYAMFYTVERHAIVAVEYAVEVHIPDPTRSGVAHLFTQRWDLVTKNDAGRYFITDHKFVAKIESKTVDRYALSLQFISMAWLGAKIFGSAFGGIVLNLVGVSGPPFSYLRRPPPAVPDAVSRFPWTLARAEGVIASLKDTDPYDAPRNYSETTCVTAYGKCPCWEVCSWGKGALTPDGRVL